MRTTPLTLVEWSVPVVLGLIVLICGMIFKAMTKQTK